MFLSAQTTTTQFFSSQTCKCSHYPDIITKTNTDQLLLQRKQLLPNQPPMERLRLRLQQFHPHCNQQPRLCCPSYPLYVATRLLIPPKNTNSSQYTATTFSSSTKDLELGTEQPSSTPRTPNEEMSNWFKLVDT